MRSIPLSLFLGISTLATLAVTSQAEQFRTLDSFSSEGLNKRLHVRLTAKPARVTVGGYAFDTFVYEACRYTPSGKHIAQCSRNSGLFSGPRFVLQQGDELQIDLRNQLTPFSETNPESQKTYAVEQMTNLHTHGLVVKANEPATPGGRYGDYIFVAASPASGSGGMPSGHHMGSTTMVNGAIDYGIKIPPYKTGASPQPCNGSAESCGEHPSGIFWFHPHVHGLAKEQVTMGMTGMINVGRLRDYVCLKPGADGTCKDAPNVALPPMRHIMLKDVQLLNLNEAQHTATVLFDQDAGFCAGQEDVGLNGYCEQKDTNGQVTGKWLHTLNGAVYPSWQIRSGQSEIWRIQNASANVTYDLRLGGGNSGWDAADPNGGMPFQVVSLDGVGLGLVDPSAPGPNTTYEPQALQRRAILMPGSRIEIRVTYRDPAHCDVATGATVANCPTAAPQANKIVQLASAAFRTGGDIWPKLNLAEVTFKGRAGAMAPANAVALMKNPLTIPGSVVSGDVFNRGTARTAGQIPDLCTTGKVRRLAAGERRRVYFGILSDEDHGDKQNDPNWRPEVFVLGHSIVTAAGQEIDEDGNPLADGPELMPMDGSDTKSGLCAPNVQEPEPWELVNVSSEVHNFHIHQNKFSVALDENDKPMMRIQDPIDAQNLPAVLISKAGMSPVQHDTIVVPRGSDACTGDVGTSATDNAAEYYKAANYTPERPVYKFTGNKACRGDANANDTSGAINVLIPFNRPENVGKYVYHCHILEHEDLGMMASIRVLSKEEMGLQ